MGNKSEITWNRSIFTRLIVTLMIIMLVMLVIGIGIFKWSSNQMTDEIYKSAYTQVSYYMNSFDNEIERIKSLQIDLTQDDDINRIANAYPQMDNFERTKAVLRIQRRLSVIKNSSIYIDNVRIFIPSIKWSINDRDYRSGYSELTDADIAEINKLSADSDSQMIYQNGRLFLFVIFPSYSVAEPSFWIEVELSAGAIKNALMRLDNYKDSGFLLEKPSQGFQVENGSGILAGQFREILGSRLAKSNSGTVSMNVGGSQYLLIYETSKYTNMKLLIYLPKKDVLNSLNKLELWYWALFLLVVITILFYSYYSFRRIRKPLTQLIKAFKNVESGDFKIKVEYARRDEIGHLYGHFNEMVGNLKTLIDQVYTQKILTQKAELKQLQSQINPHFLYNSYFLLHRIIKREDYSNAVKFSREMGTYFQFITRSASDVVPLKSEIEHARIYTEIQAMRFERRIEAEFGDFPEEASGMQVPKLILQPIIENAFEHGLENKQEGGMLTVRFTLMENGIEITVEDNGEELNDEELERLARDLRSEEDGKETTGIININRRLGMLCGEESGISVSRSELGGLKVRITILESEEVR